MPLGAPAVSKTPLQPLEVRAAIPQIERYIRASMQAWQVPGLAVGIVAGDELVYAKGFGVRQHGSNDAVNADTVFQIGSTTKAFLGATEAMLVDRGKLNWTDKVVDHYPRFRLADSWATRQFEIADLLAQRSGLPFSTLTNMTFYDYPREDIISALRFIEPVTSFRSSFAYQNAFHLVAGKIIAHNAGVKTWEDFLKTQLLVPLGMTSSSYTADALAQSPNWARGHRGERQVITIDPLAPFPYNAGGAGNLNSTIKDMSRWLRFQINLGEIDGQRIISAEALRQTHQPRIAITGPLHEMIQLGEHDNTSYATGWMIHSTPQGRVIEHGGGTAGYTSHVAFDPDRRFGVVVLTNLSIDIGNGLALPLGKYIVDLLQKRPTTDYASQMLTALRHSQAAHAAKLKTPDDPRPARPLDAYTGAYSSPTLGPVTIQVNDHGKLAFALGPRNVPVVLEHWDGDVFISSARLPASGPNPFIEKKKLRFLSAMQGDIAGFDWTDQGDGAGHPPFTRDHDDKAQAGMRHNVGRFDTQALKPAGNNGSTPQKL